jgi:hypothetical protein
LSLYRWVTTNMQSAYGKMQSSVKYIPPIHLNTSLSLSSALCPVTVSRSKAGKGNGESVERFREGVWIKTGEWKTVCVCVCVCVFTLGCVWSAEAGSLCCSERRKTTKSHAHNSVSLLQPHHSPSEHLHEQLVKNKERKNAGGEGLDRGGERDKSARRIFSR